MASERSAVHSAGFFATVSQVNWNLNGRLPQWLLATGLQQGAELIGWYKVSLAMLRNQTHDVNKNQQISCNYVKARIEAEMLNGWGPGVSRYRAAISRAGKSPEIKGTPR